MPEQLTSNQQGAVLEARPWGYLGQFRAMASPCELLIPTRDVSLAGEILTLAIAEALRIEHKYSRFITGNLLWRLNHSHGRAQPIDAETYRLLTFARQCFELSEGRFDITAGPLMRLWRFEQGKLAVIPSEMEIQSAKALVNFGALRFTSSRLTLPAGMYLDLGGIAKEYAVDSTALLIARRWPQLSVLVNFGGDIACPVAKSDSAWQVGIEDPNALDNAAAVLEIRQGALATSGDTRRFIEVNGTRYGHIIDPSTGYPVKQAPRSVTVLAPNCVMAGMLSTMAMLQGADAESFLENQNIEFKIFR